MIEQDQVMLEVLQERDRQDKKWGEQNHSSFKWMTILGEEFGEACKGAFEEDSASYREELVQCAAVCIAAIENLDRNK